MRYLVRARVKRGCEQSLLQAIENGTLGEGSVAEGEYLRNMKEARLCADDTARWVEVCYCPTPLLEERPYWEQYFELTRVQDAHERRRRRDRRRRSSPVETCRRARAPPTTSAHIPCRGQSRWEYRRCDSPSSPLQRRATGCVARSEHRG